MGCCLYILQSGKVDRFYIGVADDLEDRIERHNRGRSLSTKSARPWKVVYTVEFGTRSEAMARERQLKKRKSRGSLKRLIDRRTDASR